jgi:hypothetical protein
MKSPMRIGCESYLYKDAQCCLNKCNASECPEPVCAMEFPGGINAYLRYKSLHEALLSGMNLEQAAVYLNISKSTAIALFKKGKKVLVH